MTRLHSYLLSCCLLFVISCVLIWHASDRERILMENNRALQDAILKGAATEIANKLTYYREHVAIFAEEYGEALAWLKAHPEDEAYKEWIGQRIERRFPNHLAFTVTNKLGIPMISEIDSLVGNACQIELKEFSALNPASSNVLLTNDIYIHPQPFNYHFDIMSRWTFKQDKGVFFVSFRPDEIAAILKNYQLPEHELMLILNNGSGLIEITANGSRDHLKGKTHIPEKELKQFYARQAIKNTRWQLVDHVEKSVIEKQRLAIWKETAIVLALILFLNVALLMIFWGMAKKK